MFEFVQNTLRFRFRFAIAFVVELLVFSLLIAVLIFVVSFFPSPSSLHDVSAHDANIVLTRSSQQPSPCHSQQLSDHVVFLVIDAFRADMILGEHAFARNEMPFLHSMMKAGKAFSFVGVADSPTVTMPRIKAIVSGGIPAFIDMLFNLDSKEFTDESIISLLVSRNSSMHFFGDDTWLRLFPNAFQVSEGTSSFFVSDSITVDSNVTRNLDREFSNWDEWELLILHYLGVDHVGHVHGPFSRRMREKIREMDDITRSVFSELSNKYEVEKKKSRNGDGDGGDDDGPRPPLLIVLSDHGMTDGGNHGGASRAEKHSLMMFLSPAFEQGSGSFDENSYNLRDQVDFTPTLSSIFGLDIPAKSMGIVIDEVVGELGNKDRQVESLRCNVNQVHRLLESYDLHETIQEFSDNFARCMDSKGDDDDDAISACRAFLSSVQGSLVSAFTRFDKFGVLWSIALNVAANLFLIRLFFGIFVFGLDPKFGNVFVMIGFVKVVIRFGISYGSLRLLNFLFCFANDDYSSSPFCSVKHGFAAISFSSGNVVSILVHVVFAITSALLSALFSTGLNSKFYHNALGFVKKRWSVVTIEGWVSIGVIFVFPWFFASSSYCEDEHVAWTFLSGTLIVLMMRRCFSNGIRKAATLCLLLLLAVSVLRIYRYFYDLVGLLERKTSSGAPSLVLLISCVVAYSVFLFRILRFAYQTHQIHRRSMFTFMFFALMASFGVVFYHSLCILPALASWRTSWREMMAARFVFVNVLILVELVVLGSTSFAPPSSFSSFSSSASSGSGSFSLLFFPRYLTLPSMILMHSLTLFSLLLHRPANSGVFLVLLAIGELLRRIRRLVIGRFGFSSDWPFVLLISCICQNAFFALGNSNSIATIDLAGAYVGLSNYSHVLVGFLMVCTTYSPVFWSFTTSVSLIGDFLSVERKQSISASSSSDYVKISLKKWIGFFIFLVIARHLYLSFAFSTILFAVRGHLFIWSVFSPKYVYVALGLVGEMTLVIVLGCFFLFLIQLRSFRSRFRSRTLSRNGE